MARLATSKKTPGKNIKKYQMAILEFFVSVVFKPRLLKKGVANLINMNLCAKAS